jgi:hypothetical protein
MKSQVNWKKKEKGVGVSRKERRGDGRGGVADLQGASSTRTACLLDNLNHSTTAGQAPLVLMTTVGRVRRVIHEDCDFVRCRRRDEARRGEATRANDAACGGFRSLSLVLVLVLTVGRGGSEWEDG